MAKEKPLTREDVLRLIKENGGTAEGLDLSNRRFVEAIDLSDLDLHGIILNGAYLEGANLEMATLWDANLKGANLMYAQLKGADLTHVHLKGANLQGASLEEANLIGAHLEGAILVGAYLVGADLRIANLAGAYLGGASLDSSTKLENVNWGDYILDEERSGPLDWAADSYRQLKMWHTNAGMYGIAAEFYYREMEVKRKALSWRLPQEERRFRWWLLRGEKVRLSIYRWLYGYGEKPWRVVMWGLLVLFGLALVYFLLRGVAPHTLTVQAFLGSLYYSAVSFTALGYGPWFSASSVRSWVQGVGAAESFIGVFMIALFLVTFVRKMTR